MVKPVRNTANRSAGERKVPSGALAQASSADSLLLLVTVVHRSPAVSPYKYLMWLMQLVALLYLSSITLRWLKYFTDPRYFTDTPSDHEPEVEGGPWEQKEALEAGSGVEFTFRE